MEKFYFFGIWFLIFLATTYAARLVKTGCLEREKALTLLETAEDLLSKAEDSLPSCREELNSTDPPECGSKKPLAYIEITKKMISNVRENFPMCPKAIVQPNIPRDCSEILERGQRKNGIYTIWPKNADATGEPLKAYCDMETDTGGWTVIQRRGKYQLQQDFYRDWESYKNGFGNITEEFWLGNENIRVLCHEGCKIRFDLQSNNGTKGFAVYTNFNLTGSYYQIHISGYTGTAGDAMQFHNKYEFSTKDKDRSGKAKEYQSGWWHGPNYYSNLNGIYQPGSTGVQQVYWWNFQKYDNLASVEIKVKPH